MQTVLINSPFCGTLFSDNLRFINWEGHAEGTHGGISRVVRDCAREDVVVEACGNSPDVLFAEDIVRLRSGTSGETTGNGAGTHMYPPPPMTHMYPPPPMTTGNGAGTHMYPPPPTTHMYPPPPMTTGNGAGTSGDTHSLTHSHTHTLTHTQETRRPADAVV